MRMDKDLKAKLLAVYSCPRLRTPQCLFTCGRDMRFQPRGFFGAEGSLADVKLVLIAAEPGDPADEEHIFTGVPLDDLVTQNGNFRHFYDSPEAVTRSRRALRFHSNLRRFIEMCWHDEVPIDSVWKHTWYTNSVLCSAKKPCDPIPPASEIACFERHVSEQLMLFPGAYKIALGGKARRRLERQGVPLVDSNVATKLSLNDFAYHPSYWIEHLVRKDHERAAVKFKQWLRGWDNRRCGG